MFTGHVFDLRDPIYFEGDSVEGLETLMRRAVDYYLSICERRGEETERPFSRLAADDGPHQADRRHGDPPAKSRCGSAT